MKSLSSIWIPCCPLHIQMDTLSIEKAGSQLSFVPNAIRLVGMKAVGMEEIRLEVEYIRSGMSEMTPRGMLCSAEFMNHDRCGWIKHQSDLLQEMLNSSLKALHKCTVNTFIDFLLIFKRPKNDSHQLIGDIVKKWSHPHSNFQPWALIMTQFYTVKSK